MIIPWRAWAHVAWAIVIGQFDMHMDAFAYSGAMEFCDTNPPCAVDVGLTIVRPSSTSTLI